MNFYIDIQIKPDAEMRENVLLNKVYSKLHKALYTLKANNIAVSFPKHKVLLGNIIRLHGTTEPRLSELQNQYFKPTRLRTRSRVTTAFSLAFSAPFARIPRNIAGSDRYSCFFILASPNLSLSRSSSSSLRYP